MTITHRRLQRLVIVPVAAASLGLLAGTLPAGATPPGIPSAATARADLGELTVAPDGSMDGYDRDKFPHWIAQEGSCNTREDVLKRDGDDVTVGDDCYPTSGSWTSAYDGETTTTPSQEQIDHVVPLADAWRTGAADWTTDQREAFANDLSAPQLIAVSASSNEEKSDQTPDQWMPPAQGFRCTYAEMYVAVKHKYSLTVTSAEKSSLQNTLNGC